MSNNSGVAQSAERHKPSAEGGLSPQHGKIFLPKSTFSADSLTVSAQPYVW